VWELGRNVWELGRNVWELGRNVWELSLNYVLNTLSTGYHTNDPFFVILSEAYTKRRISAFNSEILHFVQNDKRGAHMR
jgi:hypothetical protein